MILEVGAFTTGSGSTDIIQLNNIVNNLYGAEFTVGKTQSSVNGCIGYDDLTNAVSVSWNGSGRQNSDNTKSIKVIDSSGNTVIAGKITAFSGGYMTITWSTAASGWSIKFLAFGD